MQYIKHIGLSLGVFFLIALSSGCVREEFQGCVYPVDLSFSYLRHLYAEDGDRFTREVSRVDLYVFNEKGLFVCHQSEENDCFPADYRLRMDIPGKGTYTVIALGSNHYFTDFYQVGERVGEELKPLKKGKSRMEAFQVELKNRDESAALAPLFYGRLEGVVVAGESAEHYTVAFTKDSNKITVLLTGLDHWATRSFASEALRPIDEEHQSRTLYPTLDTYIFSNNGCYSADNTIVLGENVTYHPFSREVVGTALVVEQTVLRVLENAMLNFEIYDQVEQRIIYRIDLTKVILSVPKYQDPETLVREDDFIIEIDLKVSGEVTLKVNGWVGSNIPEVIG